MLFLEEDAPLLKAWIVKRIENTSDADSDVLADYVIALLKHDGDEGAIRKLCEQEIPDFLTEEPKVFLDDVFQAIKYRSYTPGAAPQPHVSGAGQLPARIDSSPHSGAKKRTYGDSADHGDGNDQDPSYLEHRSYKQARRGARRGSEDGRGGRHGSFRPGALSALPAGMPQFDPNNPMEAILQMQAMGIPFPPMQGYIQPPGGARHQRNLAKRKGRCHDFDTKGYCSRGSTCPYDHGNESIYVPPGAANGEEYDPNDAVMQMPHMVGQGYLSMFNPEPPRGRGGRKARGANNRGGRKGGPRAPFSAEGPVNDRSKSTIVVESIPEESFSEEHVRDFFSQFGNIIEVSMQPYKHLAIVKYDDWAAANNAYRSPKAIFDNRFVKVFWYKDVDTRPQSASANGGGAPPSQSNTFDGAPPEPEIDMEEFQRRQEEAQRQHQERQTKKEELERQRQELEKKHQDLLAKHQAETEQLRARLMEKNGGERNSGSTSTDLLKAQLAALEQEAKILGLDPNAVEDGGLPSFRGGYRGRRGYRGRGAGFPHRGRGSFRGQGPRHAAYAQYSLDNRPKKVAVRGVDFTATEKDEVLRHFLLNLGEFESVDTAPSVTYVSFQDRKTAERFYFGLHGKELPGVEGKLDLSWESSNSGPRTTARPGAGSSSAPSDDGAAGGTGGGDDEGQGFSKDDAGSATAQRPVDMDYAMGDDEGWDEGIQ